MASSVTINENDEFIIELIDELLSICVQKNNSVTIINGTSTECLASTFNTTKQGVDMEAGKKSETPQPNILKYNVVTVGSASTFLTEEFAMPCSNEMAKSEYTILCEKFEKDGQELINFIGTISSEPCLKRNIAFSAKTVTLNSDSSINISASQTSSNVDPMYEENVGPELFTRGEELLTSTLEKVHNSLSMGIVQCDIVTYNGTKVEGNVTKGESPKNSAEATAVQQCEYGDTYSGRDRSIKLLGVTEYSRYTSKHFLEEMKVAGKLDFEFETEIGKEHETELLQATPSTESAEDQIAHVNSTNDLEFEHESHAWGIGQVLGTEAAQYNEANVKKEHVQANGVSCTNIPDMFVMNVKDKNLLNENYSLEFSYTPEREVWKEGYITKEQSLEVTSSMTSQPTETHMDVHDSSDAVVPGFLESGLPETDISFAIPMVGIQCKLDTTGSYQIQANAASLRGDDSASNVPVKDVGGVSAESVAIVPDEVAGTDEDDAIVPEVTAIMLVNVKDVATDFERVPFEDIASMTVKDVGIVLVEDNTIIPLKTITNVSDEISATVEDVVIEDSATFPVSMSDKVFATVEDMVIDDEEVFATVDNLLIEDCETLPVKAITNVSGEVFATVDDLVIEDDETFPVKVMGNVSGEVFATFDDMVIADDEVFATVDNLLIEDCKTFPVKEIKNVSGEVFATVDDLVIEDDATFPVEAVTNTSEEAFATLVVDEHMDNDASILAKDFINVPDEVVAIVNDVPFEDDSFISAKDVTIVSDDIVAIVDDDELVDDSVLIKDGIPVNGFICVSGEAVETVVNLASIDLAGFEAEPSNDDVIIPLEHATIVALGDVSTDQGAAISLEGVSIVPVKDVAHASTPEDVAYVSDASNQSVEHMQDGGVSRLHNGPVPVTNLACVHLTEAVVPVKPASVVYENQRHCLEEMIVFAQRGLKRDFERSEHGVRLDEPEAKMRKMEHHEKEVIFCVTDEAERTTMDLIPYFEQEGTKDVDPFAVVSDAGALVYSCDADIKDADGTTACLSVEKFSQSSSSQNSQEVPDSPGDIMGSQELELFAENPQYFAKILAVKKLPMQVFQGKVFPDFDPGRAVFHPPPPCNKSIKVGLSKKAAIKSLHGHMLRK